jgi:hypothetical protein
MTSETFVNTCRNALNELLSTSPVPDGPAWAFAVVAFNRAIDGVVAIVEGNENPRVAQ